MVYVKNHCYIFNVTSDCIFIISALFRYTEGQTVNLISVRGVPKEKNQKTHSVVHSKRRPKRIKQKTETVVHR